ncbi:MAG: hypothetical protein IJB83_01475 [Bacilli bacterium]|nr:hypothetical protein [Bacilli bacterium]
MKYYFKSKSKKYLLATILLLSLCPLLGLTYSSFIFSSDNYRASEMYIGSLMYGIKINDESVSKITVEPGETEVNIEITSLNTVSSFYKLIYKENSNILVEYNEDNDLPSGNISNKRNITIKITNSSSSNIEVEFDIASGYITNTIEQVIIPQGYTEVTGIYIVNDINIVALYVDNEKVDTLDSSTNYELESYTCTNNEVVTWNNDTKAITIKPITEATGCTLYFNRKYTLYEKILADNNNGMSDANIDFSQISSNTNGKGLYYTSDLSLTEDLNGDGTGERVYYYRGAVTNNNVRFGGFCWRIVRTNEDGSVRLRYNGEYSNGTCPVTGTEVKINNTDYYFNEDYDDQKYNEYIWEDGTGESLAKTTIDEWYTSSGLEDYEDQIANVPYCADKSNPTTKSYDETFYGAANRLVDITTQTAKSDAQPTYKCADIEDKHTVSGDSWGGNGKLSKPIGLLTVDEVAYAGGRFYQGDGSSNNSTYYLYTSAYFWTISPFVWYSDLGEVRSFYVVSTGSLIDGCMDVAGGLLPAVSLKAETMVNAEGNGTYTNPYVVES